MSARKQLAFLREGAPLDASSDQLSPEKQAWVRKDPKKIPRDDNPASWVHDEAAWERAKSIVKPHWDKYDEPWAVVTHIYQNITGT